MNVMDRTSKAGWAKTNFDDKKERERGSRKKEKVVSWAVQGESWGPISEIKHFTSEKRNS